MTGRGGGAVTPDTPFIIGSVSRSMTALAVLQLVEGGLVGLDDPLVRHLPGFEVRSAAWPELVTVRRLLAPLCMTRTTARPDDAHELGLDPGPRYVMGLQVAHLICREGDELVRPAVAAHLGSWARMAAPGAAGDVDRSGAGAVSLLIPSEPAEAGSVVGAYRTVTQLLVLVLLLAVAFTVASGRRLVAVRRGRSAADPPTSTTARPAPFDDRPLVRSDRE